ncbi:19761_t:CDS:1, partial [Racocetra persica]
LLRMELCKIGLVNLFGYTVCTFSNAQKKKNSYRRTCASSERKIRKRDLPEVRRQIG